MSSPSAPELEATVNHLSLDVAAANGASLEERRAVVERWLSNPMVWVYADQEIADIDQAVYEYYELLAVGMAGLARILHVGANGEIVPKAEIENPAQGRIVEKAIISVGQAQAIHGRLSSETLPPWTIHNHNPIDWEGEISQDMAQTWLNMGDQPLAVEVLDSALERVNHKLQSLKTVDLETPDLELKKQNLLAFHHRKKYLGARSAKAVLLYRSARAQKSVPVMNQALSELLHLQPLLTQRDRLMNVFQQAGKALLDTQYQGTIGDRLQLTGEMMKTSLYLVGSKVINR